MRSPRFRILCTEDDRDTRDLIKMVFTQNNCEVITGETPVLALELAKARPFDLYLIDNWMPEISGTDLCEALRLFDSETPILFYSGAAYPKDKEKAFACGAQGYLTKPTGNDELVAEVFRLIEEARAKRTPAIAAPPPALLAMRTTG
ncbi:MAG: two-component system, OmpR family, response regulator [Blastocatellia bacterium]|jgi:DNA-binding response OmpR family regulator|nr:two-component system, OmpR family, response regulator [Blastocatellia bacterium]